MTIVYCSHDHHNILNMMIWSAAFVSLEDAMNYPHGTEVGVIAVVASVGPWIFVEYDPFGIREICLKDTRLEICVGVFS